MAYLLPQLLASFYPQLAFPFWALVFPPRLPLVALLVSLQPASFSVLVELSFSAGAGLGDGEAAGERGSAGVKLGFEPLSADISSSLRPGLPFLSIADGDFEFWLFRSAATSCRMFFMGDERDGFFTVLESRPTLESFLRSPGSFLACTLDAKLLFILKLAPKLALAMLEVSSPSGISRMAIILSLLF